MFVRANSEVSATTVTALILSLKVRWKMKLPDSNDFTTLHRRSLSLQNLTTVGSYESYFFVPLAPSSIRKLVPPIHQFYCVSLFERHHSRMSNLSMFPNSEVAALPDSSVDFT